MKQVCFALLLSVVLALGLRALAIHAGADKADAAVPTIAAEYQTAQDLSKAGKYAEALVHYRKIVELASQQGTLTALEYYAMGAAYLNLVAESCDKALQAGGLDEEQTKKAQMWRDHVWPAAKGASSTGPGQAVAPTPAIAAEYQAAQDLSKAGKYAEALVHYRKIAELAAQREMLTGPEYYALAAAYLNLVAESCDKALQAGGLEEEQTKKAQTWRDHLWPAQKVAGAPASPGGTLQTVDVSDIVVKEHHWVENGYGVRWTPDGKYVVFCRKNDGFYVMDPQCRNVRPLGKGMYFEGVSPDGKTLYGSRPKEGLSAINVEDGAIRQLTTTECGYCDWSPNGKFVVVGLGFEYDDRAKMWFCKGAEHAVMNADGTNLQLLKGCRWMKGWDPEGNKVLYGDDESVYVANADGSGIRAIAGGSIGRSFGWLGRTGKVFVRKGKGITAMKPDGTGSTTIIGRTNVGEPSFSPSGNWALYSDPDAPEIAPILQRLADGKKINLGSLTPYPPIWLPGEDRVILCTRSGFLWQLQLLKLQEPEVGKLLGMIERIWSYPALSPDARIMAFVMGEPAPQGQKVAAGQLGVASTEGATGKFLAPIGTIEAWSTATVFSPLGNAIAYTTGSRVGVIIIDRKGS